ncbi:protein FAR1-RELATED SEQUENCE 5-like [Rosa sericea]
MSSVDISNEVQISNANLQVQNMESGSDMNHLQYNCVRFDRLSTNDVLGKEFKSVEEAEIFYFAYAKAMGFDVRKDDKYVSARTGRVTIRQLVCSAQGKRREEYMNNSNKVRMPKKLTRCNCPCLFKVRYFKKKNSYVVVDFKTNHSHDLARPHESHLLKSHRSVPDSHLALAKSMRRVPIKVCHTYQYMADRAGGLTKVGFLRKDLYNKLDISRREALLEGDAKAALSYLEGKVATDKKLFCKYSTDESNSTYKTNHYEKPLVLFAGSNHHLSTTIFGFALLVDETVETYTWALQMFLESMEGKKPIVVLTDGDEAMRKAIEVVFPDCPHRLCTWHIAKNAQSNLHNLEVIAEFRRCMFDKATPYGFEQRWNDMVNKFDLHDKNWVRMMYEKRHKWAEAFISGHFFARMRSTQWCEGMNNCLEKHASTIYTDNVFYLVREEIERVGGLITSRIMRFRTSRVYITSSYNNNEENECTTVYHHLESNPRIVCSCKLFECEGIPCGHSFNIMKHEHMNEIPLSLVMKRWTKHAKSEIQSTIPEDNIPCEALQLIRFDSVNERVQLALRLLKHPNNLALSEIEKGMQSEESSTKVMQLEESEESRGTSVNRNTKTLQQLDETLQNHANGNND